MTTLNRPTFVLCPPDHFDVSYVINPWMDPAAWASRRDELIAGCRQGWRELADALRQAGADIEILPAAPSVPDMVFTANIGFVLNGTAVLARFRHPERQREEPHISRFFEDLLKRGRVERVLPCPNGLFFEGFGDAVWDVKRQRIWMGYGPRTSPEMAPMLRDIYGVSVTPLELIDPRFYHLDTALCALSGGEVLYVPDAFNAQGLAAIEAAVDKDRRLIVGEEDAVLLGANGIPLGNHYICGGISEELRRTLAARGYQIETPAIAPFRLSGGAAYCLSLRLDHKSAAFARRQAA